MRAALLALEAAVSQVFAASDRIGFRLNAWRQDHGDEQGRYQSENHVEIHLDLNCFFPSLLYL